MRKFKKCKKGFKFVVKFTLSPWAVFRLREFADGIFKFDENVKTFFNRVRKAVRKGEIVHYEHFSHRVINELVLQTRKNTGLFEEGLVDSSRVNISAHIDVVQGRLTLTETLRF